MWAATTLGVVSGCSLLFEPASTDAGLAEADDSGPVSACSGQLADFEDVEGADPMVLGSHGGINFGQQWNRWQPDGDINPHPSSVAAFAIDSNRREFSYVSGPRRLVSATVYYFDREVTVTFRSNQTSTPRSVTVSPETPEKSIAFDFAASGMVEVSSTSGFNFFIDDICHEAP